MTQPISSQPPDVQQQILALIKQRGEATTAEIATELDVTYEAVRQQLKQLEASRLVTLCHKPNPSGVGRPIRHYALSAAGDHLFPKNYDQLTVELIDAIAGTLGPDALRQVLAALTDEQVRQWSARLEGKSLEERLHALQGIYFEGDPFTEVSHANGELALVERNCPFLNVASRRPALCSVTVSTLSRLLGRRVTRVQRFQQGHGRCLFRVEPHQPPPDFQFEFEQE